MAEYHYSDGSGNFYHLLGDHLTYDPVQMLESSSLCYSGGEKWEAILTEEQVGSLIALFEVACQNRTFRQEKRTLGSAQIRRVEVEESFTVILAMRSPDKSKIERFFDHLKTEQSE